ncbi:hypothetical protein SAMD00019534_049730 [Acytostelium subglobosum LB1]|uniref:hypothetical protein n=1 Tax=Acytostelium subglobosum LB1 TaxID=1410327 RepID=UPI000644EF48|nr:hypothetical protein SAMD00019534_049730 [Acytostelium subglobosum LB1]GAM21798.1 hypothetical protein SAMD00019534_049730 [Acytostelium subglobosum LB1]|eukprot:XP_012754898.1 hypothetical protein SAMD00019534_049730 [Acytostelium subglobosum LB1]
MQQINTCSRTADYQMTRACDVGIDQNTLDHIREQVQSCFTLMEMAEKFTHDLDHHIMYIESDNYSFFSPMTNTWTRIEKDIDGSFSDLHKATVYARGNVYIFGVGDDQKYLRFSLADRQWHCHDMIDGMYHMSAAYDGDKHIYLIGGTFGAKVSMFDIETQQFHSVGELDHPIFEPFTLVHSNILFIFNCLTTNEYLNKYITFDLDTFEEINYDLPGRIDSLVYDGHDKVYILFEGGKGRFIKVRRQ